MPSPPFGRAARPWPPWVPVKNRATAVVPGETRVGGRGSVRAVMPVEKYATATAHGRDVGHGTRDVKRAHGWDVGHGTRDVKRAHGWDVGHETRDVKRAHGRDVGHGTWHCR